MNKAKIIKIAQWMLDNCLVIDTETTGLGENDTIASMALINPRTRAAYVDCLVVPLSPMSVEAEKVHKLTELNALEAGLDAAKAISNVISHLNPLIETSGGLGENPQRKFIASYNIEFDVRMLKQTAYRAQRPDLVRQIEKSIADGTTCIMELANRYFHEHLHWNPERAQFSRLSLEKCLEITGIPRIGEVHDARSDTEAAIDLLHFIAEGKQC